MKSRIPSDAFEFYVSQGEQRSYQATADHFGVSKCAITKCAKRESWAERLEKIEVDARAISDKHLTESIAEMHERHAKALKAIYARAAEALRNMPLDNCMDAVKAVDMVIRAERLMAGEATKRTEQSIPELMKAEMRMFLERVPDDEDEPRVIEAVVAVGAGREEDPADEAEAEAEIDHE